MARIAQSRYCGSTGADMDEVEGAGPATGQSVTTWARVKAKLVGAETSHKYNMIFFLRRAILVK